MLRPRKRPVDVWFHAFVVVAAMLIPTVSTAASGPVGPEYAVNDRPLPPKQWWTSCTDSAGNRATLVHYCEGNRCDDEPGDLYIRRYNSNGDAKGPAVQVNESPAWLVGFRVACSDDGWVVAQWREASCYKHRAFNPHNQPGGPTTSAGASDCRVRPNVAIGDDGTMVAAWPDWLPAAGSQILVQRFEPGGEPLGDGVVVSDDATEARVQPKVSIDGSGAALVTWLGQVDRYNGHGPVAGRFVGADGQPTGEAFQINTFGYGENSDPAIARIGAGVFEVAWNNPLEGGRLAREVHVNGAASIVADVAATPARFGAPRVVDSERGLGFAGGSLAGTDHSSFRMRRTTTRTPAATEPVCGSR
ncbi:MAG: hypothetical protein ABR587_10890 [Candidatus Binatia bacterium]